MPGIAFDSLTKHYGEVTALDGLTVRVVARPHHRLPRRERLRQDDEHAAAARPLRAGLRDCATIDGERYVELAHPTRRVGAVLDQGFHPNRSARNHLRIVAAQAAMPAERVDEVLDLVGLTAGGPPPGRRLLARHAPAAGAGLGARR